jgi:hypothetical protein
MSRTATPTSSARPALSKRLRVITKYLPGPTFTVASRSTHLTYVGIYLALLLLPALCSIAPGREHAEIFGLSLPGTCATKSVFDTECPGCGLTRSFISVAHGEVRKASEFHRIGPALYLFMILQVVHHAACAQREPGSSLPRLWARTNFVMGSGIIAALLLNWLLLL